MERGRVKWFDAKKGFGFIERQSGGDIFFHVSGLRDKTLTTVPNGSTVEFDVVEGKKGPQATNVTLV